MRQTLPGQLFQTVMLLIPIIGCGSDTPEATFRGEISFKVNGSEYRSGDDEFVSCCGVPPYGFSLGVHDEPSLGGLELWAEGWGGGSASFSFKPGDSTRFAHFVPDGSFSHLGEGTLFDTYIGGGGNLTVDSVFSCTSHTGKDIFTGIDGTRTYCSYAGNFAFTAENEDGTVVQITDGRFSVRTLSR